MLALFCALVGLAWAAGTAQAPAGRLLRFDEVREVLAAFVGSGLPGSEIQQGAAWDQWIRTRDRDIRARIARGVEDSISNLALYGTSYTRLPRFESAEEAVAGDELSERARARVHALALALRAPAANERLRFARQFLDQRRVPPAAREALLAANLKRFVAEQGAYQEKLAAASQAGDPGKVLLTRGTLFEKRGLSVDTSLLPNFAIEDTLRVMLEMHAISPGSVRRIAVIGPGLDFTDKRDGFDFYPLQTIQPFAVMEAAIRLKLADAPGVELSAFDLNPLVLGHIRLLAERGRAGQPYVVQLPRDEAAGWSSEALAYWQHFGDVIGSPATPRPVPKGLPAVHTRAVSIGARYAARVTEIDLDIVAQTLDAAPGAGFDLVVATNVLVYYDRLQQALAMASIARMMNPGGVFLSNTVLPAQHPESLQFLGRRSVSYSSRDAFGDDVVAYRRR